MTIEKNTGKVLILGSGPIVIGQGCEFDYSGTQALIALKERGYEAVVVNPNPATVMNSSILGGKIYMEPLEVPYIEEIIRKEKPSGLIGTFGGQTALNLTMELHNRGILEKYGVKLLGVSVQAIRRGEDRQEFKDLVTRLGYKSPQSLLAHSLDEARSFHEEFPLPLILRPSYTLGGVGGGIIEKEESFDSMVNTALQASTVHEVLVEQSLLGWAEFEMEVIADATGNAIVVCSIENIDPMGIHTGDSITMAPAINLPDQVYQDMRDASLAIIREVGVTSGGVNVQFAIHPETYEMMVIEMNPRVSRSSALASKATGYPIARVSLLLALGYSLDQVQNEITHTTSAAFEPALDYMAVKVPRFELEKFPLATSTLGTQMRSVGESLAIGRTFIEALNKGIRGCEDGREGLVPLSSITGYDTGSVATILSVLHSLHPYKIHALYSFFEMSGYGAFESARQITQYHPFILQEVWEQVEFDLDLKRHDLTRERLLAAKARGMSAKRIAQILDMSAEQVIRAIGEYGISASIHVIDTCAGEFEVATPYCYLTYDEFSETRPVGEGNVLIIASGPNRVGQGLEFDTCCTQAALAYKEIGRKVIMINNNPETVSTDYTISDRLYMETLTSEEVLTIIRKENIEEVVVQLGGQTPLRLLGDLKKHHVSIAGTAYENIEICDERKKFSQLLDRLDVHTTSNRSATDISQVKALAHEVTYPLIVRPSHVLGGARMEVLYNDHDLSSYLSQPMLIDEENPLLIDYFLEDAFEYDVDVVSDGSSIYICGIMQHIEAAGIHSGDSAAVFPPYQLTEDLQSEMVRIAKNLAVTLQVKGLMNIQFASKDEKLYVIEVNPRASRTIPFLSKTSTVDIISMAVKVWEGRSLVDQGVVKKEGDVGMGQCTTGWAVKEAVFSFSRFSHLDPLLGPQMKSTGEVVGVGQTFGEAYYKSQLASGNPLPLSGKVCVSVTSSDQKKVVPIIKDLLALGFSISATKGTAGILFDHGIICEVLPKEGEGHPNIVDQLENGMIDLLINTPKGKRAHDTSISLRQVALMHGIPYTTTLSAAKAAVEAIAFAKNGSVRITEV